MTDDDLQSYGIHYRMTIIRPPKQNTTKTAMKYLAITAIFFAGYAAGMHHAKRIAELDRGTTHPTDDHSGEWMWKPRPNKLDYPQ